MGRERPDMFDVASGECELVDFLLTRFNPLDLKTKINLAPSCILDEQLAPKPPEEEPPPPPPAPQTEETIKPVLISGAPRERAATSSGPSSQDTFQSSQQATPPQPDGKDSLEKTPPAPSAPLGPDWLSLIQGFHEAAQRYQAETAELANEDNTGGQV